MNGFERSSNYEPGDFGCMSWSPPDQEEPATLAEAWAAFMREGLAAPAVRSYLGGGPVPRFDTAEARAEAQAELEAGG